MILHYPFRLTFDIIYPMINGKYLTTKEVAVKLGVTVGRVQQLVAQKRLPVLKVGNINLVKESDLVKVQERKITGRPKKAALAAKD